MGAEKPCTPDDLYEVIVGMHDGLSDEESERTNAKLIVILAQHIADADILRNAAKLARENTLRGRDSN